MRLIRLSEKKVSVQEAIHGKGWLKRKQRKEARHETGKGN